MIKGVLLAFTLRGGQVEHARDSWFGPDKLQHFFTSAFVQSLAYSGLRRVGVQHGAALAGASATTAIVGVGKEVHDRHVKGDFSYRDLTWDAAGAGAATVLLVRTVR
jgi:putative lipoprotein